MAMSQVDFCAKTTAAGSAAELQAAFDSDKKAAYFVREGMTVYYSIEGISHYDPIWALFGTGWIPKRIFCNYFDDVNQDRTKLSESEKGIWYALGTHVRIGLHAGDWPTSKNKGTFKRMTMDVSADLAALFPEGDIVQQIQEASAFVSDLNDSLKAECSDCGALWFQLSTQEAGSLSVSIPVQFVKGSHVFWAASIFGTPRLQPIKIRPLV